MSTVGGTCLTIGDIQNHYLTLSRSKASNSTYMSRYDHIIIEIYKYFVIIYDIKIVNMNENK
jgi:hypothetical protein